MTRASIKPSLAIRALASKVADRVSGNRIEQIAWSRWHVVGAVLLTGAAIFITRDAWATIFRIVFTDEESSHCLLVFIAVPWLVWSRRDALRNCRPVGTWVGPLIAVVGWASYFYGFDIHDNEFWFFGAILVAIGALLSFLGIQVLRRLLPAFIVLGFLIPMPGWVRTQVSLPLQTLMAQATEQVGQIVGFAIARSGNVLLINGRQIEIAEACNGMRMVFALFLVAYTFTFAMPLRWWVRAFVLTVAPLLALICNLFRMVPTVVLYARASNETAETFHDVAGWMMIPVAFFLLKGTVDVLQWAEVPVLQRPQRHVATEGTA